MEHYDLHLFVKKLSGEATLAETQQLNELLCQNTNLQQKLQLFEDFWNNGNCDTQEDLEEFELTYQQVLAKIEQEEAYERLLQRQSNLALYQEQIRTDKRRVHRQWLMIGLLTGLLVAGYWFTKLPANSTLADLPTPTKATATANEITTKKGSTTKIDLPDGTEVWINAVSKLSYEPDFGQRNRIVKLEGEAYFDVKANPNMPFIIKTSKGQIKVLGTAFNVRAYPGEQRFETSLIHGKVEIELNDEPGKIYRLKPMEKFSILQQPARLKSTPHLATVQKPTAPSITPLAIRQSLETPIETAWMYNTLAFEDETFSEVASKMEKWYDVQIWISDPKLESVRLTGTFRNETIENALQALQYTTPFKYTILQNQIRITAH